ncbi:MAG: pentapeptide repeat-containing protein, partial [Actinomycetota bacterium]
MNELDILKRYNQGERNFRGVNLAAANLIAANLTHSDLSGAVLKEA